MVQLWLQTLNIIGEARFDEAFRKVLNESKYRPDIAEIRAAAGIGDYDDEAAKAGLHEVFAVIRKRTVELKPLGGHIIRERDEDDRLLASPVRAPLDKFTGFPDPIHGTLERMGWGDWHKGVEVVGGHPAVSSEVEAGGWMLKTAEQIEKRWRECWKGGD